MSRLIPLLHSGTLVLLLVFTAGPALAAEQIDRIVRTDGILVEGRIQGTHDGSYWVLLADGRILEVPLEQVERVEKVDPPPPPVVQEVEEAIEEAGATVDKSEEVEAAARKPGRDKRYIQRNLVGAGFEAGTITGPRLTLNLDTRAFESVDLRGVLGFGTSAEDGGVSMLGLGFDITMFGLGPHHLTIGNLWGYTPNSKSPFVAAVGLGYQVDLGRHLVINAGMRMGALGESVGVVPDINLGLMY